MDGKWFMVRVGVFTLKFYALRSWVDWRTGSPVFNSSNPLEDTWEDHALIFLDLIDSICDAPVAGILYVLLDRQLRLKFASCMFTRM